MVQTAKVTGRRTLHFSSYQDVLDDVHALAEAPHRKLGNWSLSDICQHLAKTMHMSIDGAQATFPWYLRMLGRLLKNRIINKPMSPGFKIPGAVSGLLTPVDEDVSTAVAELDEAVARIQGTSRRSPHPMFGRLTQEEWDKLHMRHCEMHLSFVVPA